MKSSLLLLGAFFVIATAFSDHFRSTSTNADLKELENVLQQSAAEEWKRGSRQDMEEELQGRQAANVQQTVRTNVTGIGRYLSDYKEGRIIYIFGKAPRSGIVEFDLLPIYDGDYDQNDAIVLRLTINEDYHVVRNSYIHGKWLYEESEGYSGIVPGRMFSLTILCQCYGYEISTEGYHLATYNHRIPFTKEMWIGVNQDIYIDDIEYH